MPADQFYDRLSGSYHLLYPDWDKAIAAHARVLSQVVEDNYGLAKGDVLDCACGIGTQALGLAALGYPVTGTDISRKAVARASREARRRGLESARFEVADMRRLPTRFQDSFDVVLCCDNPFAHLLEPDDLRIALLAVRTALRSGGLLLASSRDYDKLLLGKPREMAFRHRTDGSRTCVVFQIWDWDSHEPTYVNRHFILTRRSRGWKTIETSTKMRAYTRSEIADELEAAGFAEIKWHGTQETGYFQPMVSAVSPS